MPDMSIVIGQLVIGWLLADLLGGLAHWWEDRLGRESMPWIGPRVIAPNRRHHREPLAFVTGGLIERNLSTWILAGVVAGIWLLTMGPSLTWAAAAIGGALSSQVHYWTHQPKRAPRLVRVLQDVGLLQSPVHHAGHHRSPSDRRYCVLTDWLNPLLDDLRVWARLEALLTRLHLATLADDR